ncbi:hypothetical protein L1987_11588 [Smallanthus sonchifolius]|uniref:Uncharacterized protein n=1 Tax=Smallanthus sonchifolius TaxID=185202 RepID=A0ACB9JE15_9ASTR|nr:hypothetical protein L1987_11588 [Smallanthus sonchifolius]
MPNGSSETVKHASSAAGRPDPPVRNPIPPMKTAPNKKPSKLYERRIGRRLNSVTGTRAMVVMVVDAVDFDGSFPRKVAELVSNTIDVNSRARKEGKSGNLPDLRE